MSVWASLLNIALDRPVVPPEDEPVPAHAVVQSPQAPLIGPPTAPPPVYEYEIEPLVYLVGHGICLLFSLVTLWLLLQSPITAHHLAMAAVMWVVFAYCSYRMIQGVRYGCRLRLYKGYLELRMMGPTKVVTAREVAYFREFNRDSGTRRRFCLYLHSGHRIALPRVHDSDLLRRSLVEDMGLQQAIM